MKQIVPFYPLYVPTPKEDYFAVCAEAEKGEILSLQSRTLWSTLRHLWNEEVHVHGRGTPFPEFAPLFARRTIYNFYNNYIGQKKSAILVRRWLLNRCVRVIVHSEFARQNYIRQGIRPEKLAILPIPVDTHYFSAPASPQTFRDQHGLANRPFAICVGIRYHKNPMVMIDACLTMGLPLVLVGFKEAAETRHWGKGFLPEDQLIKLQHPLIIKTGYLSTEALRNAYQAASVYLNSSEPEGEVFCIAAYEAALSGTPLCLPDYGTFDLFEGAALFHHHRDSKALANNIQRILDDPSTAAIRATRAKEIALRFNYEAVVEAYRQFYSTIKSS